MWIFKLLFAEEDHSLTFRTSKARSLNDELRAVSKPGLLAPATVTMVYCGFSLLSIVTFDSFARGMGSATARIKVFFTRDDLP
jgi:hypothetical protein